MLANPAVDVVLAGPAGPAELDEALAALDRGPMTEDELAWMRRVGAGVKRASLVRGVVDAPVTVVDRALGRLVAKRRGICCGYGWAMTPPCPSAPILRRF